MKAGTDVRVIGAIGGGEGHSVWGTAETCGEKYTAVVTEVTGTTVHWGGGGTHPSLLTSMEDTVVRGGVQRSGLAKEQAFYHNDSDHWKAIN